MTSPPLQPAPNSATFEAVNTVTNDNLKSPASWSKQLPLGHWQKASSYSADKKIAACAFAGPFREIACESD
jgi:hypothetical protein